MSFMDSSGQWIQDQNSLANMVQEFFVHLFIFFRFFNLYFWLELKYAMASTNWFWVLSQSNKNSKKKKKKKRAKIKLTIFA